MSDRHMVRFLGIVFLAVGVMGLIPAFVSAPAAATPDVLASPGYGYVLGLFPVNFWHNMIHIAFGVWGLTAAQTILGARRYGRNIAVIYGALAIMGLIPGLNTVFGLVPLFGHDVWLHAIIAATAAYVGFGHRETATTAAEEALRRRAG